MANLVIQSFAVNKEINVISVYYKETINFHFYYLHSMRKRKLKI